MVEKSRHQEISEALRELSIAKTRLLREMLSLLVEPYGRSAFLTDQLNECNAESSFYRHELSELLSPQKKLALRLHRMFCRAGKQCFFDQGSVYEEGSWQSGERKRYLNMVEDYEETYQEDEIQFFLNAIKKARGLL